MKKSRTKNRKIVSKYVHLHQYLEGMFTIFFIQINNLLSFIEDFCRQKTCTCTLKIFADKRHVHAHDGNSTTFLTLV